MPPRNNDANKLIHFEPQGNEYVFRSRPGGLNEEVLNTGNVQVLRSFLENNKNTLNKEEKEYLVLRIQAQEAFELERIKSAEMLSEKKERPLPVVDNKNGFSGFSGSKLPGKQSSFNGCWSCAFSLMLASRGIDMTQEQIRAWRPAYAPNNGKNPASQGSTYRRNGDTEMTMSTNADFITQLLPNTVLSSVTISPFTPGIITLSDPNAPGAEQHPTPQQLGVIKQMYKEQTKQLLKNTITRAINDERSPVALLIDGHYVTVTGIAPDGRLRIQDSMKEPTEQITTLDHVVERGLEKHDKFTYEGVHIKDVEPRGIELTYLCKVPVKEKQNAPGQIDDYIGPESHVVNVDGNGAVSINTANDEDYTKVGSSAEGMVYSKGISTEKRLDCSMIEQQLGGKKVRSLGADGVEFAHLDSYYPGKLMLPGKKHDLNREAQEAQPARPAANDKKIIDRIKLVKMLKIYKKDLESTRLVAGGTEDMLKKLRESVNGTIDALMDPNDKITDGGIRLKLDTIKLFAGFYMVEKRAEGVGNTNDPNWLPRSDMGKDRYKAAAGLSTLNLNNYMMFKSQKKDLAAEFEVVDDYVDIYANQRKMLAGVLGLANLRRPDEDVNELKDYVSMVFAQVLVVPQLYEAGKTPDTWTQITEGEYAGKTKSEAFNLMVEKVKQRPDFKEMIDGIKNATQLKKLCFEAMGKNPDKAITLRLQKTQAHKNEVEAQHPPAMRRRNTILNLFKG